jgi:hypothetical protein
MYTPLPVLSKEHWVIRRSAAGKSIERPAEKTLKNEDILLYFIEWI